MIKYEKIFEDSIKTFPMLQVKDEFLKFLEYVDVIIKPQNIMEIGLCDGATFWCWQSICRDGGIKVGIDLPNANFSNSTTKTYFELAVTKQRLEIYKPNTHIFFNNSHEKQTIDWVEKTLNGTKLDFLFIDGDHSTEGVIKDWVNWSKFVVEGGIVVFHDEPIETVRLGMEQSVRKSEFMEWASLEDRRWVAFVRPGKVWWQALAKPAF